VTLDEFLTHPSVAPRVVGRGGDKYELRCPGPAHGPSGDGKPSLGVKAGTKRPILMSCRRPGCTNEDICAALGIDPRELSRWPAAARDDGIVAQYDYHDPAGELIDQLVRLRPRADGKKRPAWRHPCTTTRCPLHPDAKPPRDGWCWKKHPRRVLYRLPQVLAAARAGERIFVVEGEKDADNLVRLGVVATSPPNGAKAQWLAEYSGSLQGAREVIIIADRDEPGREHAVKVARAVGVTTPVKVLELPGPAKVKDASDWIEAGGTRDQLERLADERPVWSAPAGAPPSTPPEDPPKRKDTAAERIVALADLAGVELFRDPDGKPFAMVPVGGHRETLPIRGKSFRLWLSRLLFQSDKRVPSSAHLADALGLLEGRAIHDGTVRPVFVRVGRADGCVYLDLGDEAWRVVKITPQGWEVLPSSASPVRFRRPNSLRALPAPVRGGTVDELRPLVNVPEEQWPLVKGWLVGALRGAGPYFALVIHGEQGSGKSTSARMLRLVLDPVAIPLRSPPKDERDVAIGASNSLVYGLDNLSGMADWFSDALCRITTGGGVATRELYSDADEATFDVTRPILLNGIDDLLTRSDLAERSLCISLPSIGPESRRQERDLWAEFARVHPRILGALLGAVACALAREASTVLERPPRMADAATWATAAEPALGIERGGFVEAMEEAREEALAQQLDGDPLVGAVRLFAEEQRDWQDPATDLLEALKAKVVEELRRDRRWPKSASALSSRLKRLAPSLRQVGVEVLVVGKGGKGSRSVRVRAIEGGAGGVTPPAGGAAANAATRAPAKAVVRGGAGGGVSRPSSYLDTWDGEDERDEH
jgi:hypothetical protein